LADKAFITPKVLKWARESARMSLETAASKVRVSPERLTEWEDGASQPTIKQAETLAKAYRRPFALFFLPQVPRDFMPLQDFRRKNARELGTASMFILREIRQKQAWIKDLYAENDEKTLPFVGRFTVKTSPDTVAADILKTLDITPGTYKTDNHIKEWIDKAEAKGVFISRTSFIHSRLKLDSEELQGFTIADPLAPFVFVNSDDWNAPQLFTLVHELAHIWIAESGISNEIEPDQKHKDKLHPVELFCNQVAAAALLPAKLMQAVEAQTFHSSTAVFRWAKKLGVSSFAFLYRALSMELISLDTYRKLKKDADLDYHAFLAREAAKKERQKESKKPGGPDYFLLLVNKNSPMFTRVVMDAYRGGFIEPAQASGLLNTQINNFPKLEAFIHK